MWSNERLRRLAAAYRAGGMNAARAAEPELSQGMLENRLFAVNGRSIVALEARERAAQLQRRVTRGGNFDTTGLLELLAGTRRVGS
jgi:hypothetical protein